MAYAVYKAFEYSKGSPIDRANVVRSIREMAGEYREGLDRAFEGLAASSDVPRNGSKWLAYLIPPELGSTKPFQLTQKVSAIWYIGL